MDDRTALVALRLMINDLQEGGVIGECGKCPLVHCTTPRTLSAEEKTAGYCGTCVVEREYMALAHHLVRPPASSYAAAAMPAPKAKRDPRWD